MVRGGEATVAGHLAVECRARAGERQRPVLFFLAHGLANDIAERTCHAGNRLELRAHTIECGLQRRRALAGLRFARSEEHTSELQSLMRISYAVFCLNKKTNHNNTQVT